MPKLHFRFRIFVLLIPLQRAFGGYAPSTYFNSDCTKYAFFLSNSLHHSKKIRKGQAACLKSLSSMHCCGLSRSTNEILTVQVRGHRTAPGFVSPIQRTNHATLNPNRNRGALLRLETDVMQTASLMALRESRSKSFNRQER